MLKATSMMDENRNSLFTKDERDAHQKTEQVLIAKAKQGAFGDLLDFWAGKRAIFIQRARERNPYAA